MHQLWIELNIKPMVLRLMRQLNAIKLKLVGVGVRCCRSVFWKNTHCSLSGRRWKGRENGEEIGERKKATTTTDKLPILFKVTNSDCWPLENGKLGRVAGVRKERELRARGRREEDSFPCSLARSRVPKFPLPLPPSPSPFNTCHAG